MSLALLFLVSVYSTEGLSCYCPTVCSEDAIEQIKQGCKGGVVDDACHCCKVCAKLEGETCGGLWDLEGRCDQGLFCKTPGEPSPYSMKRGICVKNQLTEVATVSCNYVCVCVAHALRTNSWRIFKTNKSFPVKTFIELEVKHKYLYIFPKG